MGTALSITAEKLLTEAAEIQRVRGFLYDDGKERSMGEIVELFRLVSGVTLTERQGWLFMMALKLIRAKRSINLYDSYADLISYASLLGECSLRDPQ